MRPGSMLSDSETRRASFLRRLFVESRWRWVASLAVASVVVAAVLLATDVISGALNGMMRWRLDDGSLLLLTVGDATDSATLRARPSWCVAYFDAKQEIRKAECRTDGRGNYWIVTWGGGAPSVPVFVTASPRHVLAPGFGPGQAPEEFSAVSGRVVPPAWFTLLSP
jgi:hypothetical protein